jgi:predicted nucleotidyltransferase
MIRSSIVARLTEVAVSLGTLSHGSEWHLFGSVNRNEHDASDVDLMILCQSDAQADALRQAIDPDSLALPLHLALLTYDEAASIAAADMQQSTVIFR